MKLTIGRVGLTGEVELAEPTAWGSSGAEQRVETLSGELFADALADAQALRTELLDQVGQVVAVTFSEDATFNMYGRLVDVTANAESWSLFAKWFPFSVSIERIGGKSRTMFQSMLMHLHMNNDYSVTSTESVFWHGQPLGAVAYDVGPFAPFSTNRTSAEGQIPIVIGMPGGVDPTWSCDPTNFYKGAVTIHSDGYLRAGLDSTVNPADFVVSNSLVRVRGDSTGGTSNGRVIIQHWDIDGATWTVGDKINFQFNATSGSTVPEWHFANVVTNTPEVCVLRLTRDADEAPATTHQHILDITIRRGSLFAAFYYNWTGAAVDWAVQLDDASAGTNVSVTGATGSPTMIRATDDGEGNQWVLGSAKSHTTNTAVGYTKWSTVREFDFFFAKEIGSPVTSDAADSLTLQYFGWTEESVAAVHR